MNHTGPKVRLSRRFGVALTPKAEKIMQKKGYPPGQHGTGRRRAKMSIYKRQLTEKQKFRAYYNIHERQMRNYYRKASARRTGNTADQIAQMLEQRLDAVVRHGGLARTIHAARQYVAHGHIEVNGRKVDIPSFQVAPGDVVRVREKSRKTTCFQEAIEGAAFVPSYLELNKEEMSVRLLSQPDPKEIPVVKDMELSLLVEFYSR